jgi:hypothetical protein
MIRRDVRANSAALSRALKRLAEQVYVHCFGCSAYYTPDSKHQYADNRSRHITLSVALSDHGQHRIDKYYFSHAWTILLRDYSRDVMGDANRVDHRYVVIVQRKVHHVARAS